MSLRVEARVDQSAIDVLLHASTAAWTVRSSSELGDQLVAEILVVSMWVID